jgi:nitroreductase
MPNPKGKAISFLEESVFSCNLLGHARLKGGRVMDLMEAVRKRRSIRKYKDKPLERSTILKLLEAAVWAPSGGNAQNWRFVVVTDPEVMKKRKMVAPGLLGNPPTVVVIAQDVARAREMGGKMGVDSLTKMDSAMAAQNLMLAAYAEGLGTCVIASFHPDAVRRLLRLPEEVVPQLLISVGEPDQDPAPPPRRFEEIIWWEAYNG